MDVSFCCSFLDGFSLCNLSLTCSLLRSVCCSLLEEKGMVLQEWSKLGGRRKRGKHGDSGGGGGGSDTSKEDSSDSDRARWVVSDHVSTL